MDDEEPIFTERMAKAIVHLAVLHGQEQKLLNALAEDGGVTIDPETKRLMFITEAQLESLIVYEIRDDVVRKAEEEKIYEAGESNLQADWESALSDVLPEGVEPYPSQVARYISDITKGR